MFAEGEVCMWKLYKTRTSVYPKAIGFTSTDLTSSPGPAERHRSLERHKTRQPTKLPLRRCRFLLSESMSQTDDGEDSGKSQQDPDFEVDTRTPSKTRTCNRPLLLKDLTMKNLKKSSVYIRNLLTAQATTGDKIS